MLCGNFVGIDKLERLKLLQSDPLINEFAISIKEDGILAANQDLSVEVHFPGWKDHQNRKECSDEAF